MTIEQLSSSSRYTELAFERSQHLAHVFTWERRVGETAFLMWHSPSLAHYSVQLLTPPPLLYIVNRSTGAPFRRWEGLERFVRPFGMSPSGQCQAYSSITAQQRIGRMPMSLLCGLFFFFFPCFFLSFFLFESEPTVKTLTGGGHRLAAPDCTECG